VQRQNPVGSIGPTLAAAAAASPRHGTMQNFYWVYDLPTETFAILMIAVFVGFYWAGLIFLRPILRQFVKNTRGANDIVGYVLSCFCVFYGLLLGLIAVTAYQNASDTSANVTHEAAALSALYEDVSRYPDPYGQNLRWILRDYTRYVIKYAWPLQRQGIVPVDGSIRVQAFQEKLLDFQPATPAQEILHAEALRQFNTFLEHRRMRLFSVNTAIPPVMWYVVILGAVINIAMVWLFDMRFITHLLLGGLLAAYLGTMIFLIAAMDHPFRGEVSVTPEPFEALYKHMVEE
jgi:Flp pilus assembly pilin Flp